MPKVYKHGDGDNDLLTTANKSSDAVLLGEGGDDILVPTNLLEENKRPAVDNSMPKFSDIAKLKGGVKTLVGGKGNNTFVTPIKAGGEEYTQGYTLIKDFDTKNDKLILDKDKKDDYFICDSGLGRFGICYGFNGVNIKFAQIEGNVKGFSLDSFYVEYN